MSSCHVGPSLLVSVTLALGYMLIMLRGCYEVISPLPTIIRFGSTVKLVDEPR